MTVIRYFECKIDGHSKFWEITYDDSPRAGSSYSTRWGQIGSPGSTKPKYENYTLRDIQKIINTKIGKGYKEVSKAASAPAVRRRVEPDISGGFEIF